MSFSKAALAVLSVLSMPLTSLAARIQWHSESAVALGSGCNSSDRSRPIDAFFLANGDDVSVILSGLNVNLPGGAGLPLQERKNCSVRIPATVTAGYYVGEFTQNLSYSITKTAGSHADIAVRANLFGLPLSSMSASFPKGVSINRPLGMLSRTDRFLASKEQVRQWCRVSGGTFKIDLSFSGERNSDWDDVIVSTEMPDIRLDASTYGLHVCPRE